jgi:alpha-L-fucosidase
VVDHQILQIKSFANSNVVDLRRFYVTLTSICYFLLFFTILVACIGVLWIFFDIIVLNLNIGIFVFIGAVIIIVIYARIPILIRKRFRKENKLMIKKIEVLLFICGIITTCYAPTAVYDFYIYYHGFPKPPSHYDTRINDVLSPNATGLIYNTIPGVPSAHCSSLIRLQNGEIVCTWYAGTAEKHPDVAIYSARVNISFTSMDLVWSPPVVIADTVNQSDGQPTFYQCPDGRLILFYQEMRNTGPLFDTWGPVLQAGWGYCKLKMQESSDNGHTWSNPRYLWKNYLFIFRNPPLRTISGRVLVPLDGGYNQISGSFFINNDPNLHDIWYMWGDLMAPHEASQPAIQQLDNGNIFCVLRTADNRIYRSLSHNDGTTWSTPKPMRFPNPNSNVALLKLADGRLVILCNPQTANRDRLSLILGDPTATYWSEPYDLINNPGGEYSYPSIVQAADGSLIFTYTHERWSIGWGHFSLNLLDQISLNMTAPEW